mgnify:CR=1 FL=1
MEQNENNDAVYCNECGTVCDATDAVATDAGLAFCGSFYGNGCAEKLGY